MTNTLRLFPSFRGVDVTRSPLKMGLDTSPYSLNSDFDRNSLRKRRGMKKLNRYAVPATGVYLYGTDATADAGAYILVNPLSAYNLSTSWTVEFNIKIHGGALSGILAIGNNVSGQRTLFIGLAWDSTVEKYYLYWTFDHVGGGTTTVITKNYLNKDQSYHIALVRNGTTVYLYIDGTVSDTVTTANANANVTTTYPLVIGGAYNTTSNGIVALPQFTINEVRLWNGIARNQTKIQTYCNSDLSEDDPDWTYLVGYWKLNEGDGRIVLDSSIYHNYGFFNKSSGIYVRSPVISGSEEFALCLDGYDDYAVIPYHTNYEPIDDTSKHWTVEIGFKPYYIRAGVNNTILAQGTSPFTFHIYIAASDGHYQCAVTDSLGTTVTLDSNVKAVVGVPVMVSLVRIYGFLIMYVQGVQVDAKTCNTNATNANTDADIYVGRLSTGANKACGAVDEIRFWTYARSAKQIADHWDVRLPDERASGLVGYFRCNGYSTLYDASATSNNGTIHPIAENLPQWSEGFTKAKFPPPIRNVASHSPNVAVSGQTFRQDVALAQPPMKRRLTINSGAAMFELIGDWLRLVGRGFRTVYPISDTKIGNHLILANGLDLPQKFDGERALNRLSIATPTTAPTAVAGAAGNPNGTYYGIYVYHNTKTGAYSLASPVSAQVSVSNQKIVWTVVASTDPHVDSIYIYRTVAGASSDTPFYLAATGTNSSGTITDNTADDALGDQYNPYTGVAQVVSCLATYRNMLFLAGNPVEPEALYISEIDNFEHIYALNTIYVGYNESDGIAALGVVGDELVIAKQRSIWRLVGDSPTTVALSIVSASHGTVGNRAVCQFNIGQTEFLAFIDRDGIWAYASGSFKKLSVPFDAYFNGETTRLNPHKLRHNIIANFPAKGELWAVCHFGDAYLDWGDLIARFDFSQNPASCGGSEIRDLTGNSRHLTSHGNMTVENRVTGVYQYAIELDGQDDYLTMPSLAFANLNRFSIGLWVQFDAFVNENGYLFEYANSNGSRYFNCRLNSADGELQFNLYDGTYTYHADIPISNMTVGKWHHIVCIHDGDKNFIYLDGELVDSANAEAGGYGLDWTNPFHIGTNVAHNSWAYFDGKICHLVISRDVWTAETVRLMYKEGVEARGGTVPKTQETKTLIINYLTGQTREIDRGFTALANVETDDKLTMFVGADDTGFVYELDTGNTDGVADGDVTGTVDSADADSFTDMSATFSTYGDGLKGAPVLVVMTNGTVQRRTVWKNTTTRIYVTEKWSPATITGASYYVGTIGFVHRTPIIDFGNVRSMKQVRYMNIVQTPQSVQASVTVTSDEDKKGLWTTSKTFKLDSLSERIYLGGRNHVFQFEFSQYEPNAPVELLDAEIEYEDTGAVG